MGGAPMNARPALCSPQLWCAALAVVALACKGTEPTPPPTTGDILVEATTSGADLDPDGYTVALDSGAMSGIPQTLAVNGTVTFAKLSPGSHSVMLFGSTANCLVGGANPRVASVTAGQTAQVTFQISCVQRVDVSGVWNYTERLGSAPLACNDTGSYVFTPSGDGFGGTNDQVGTCDRQDGSIDNSGSSTIAGVAVQYSSSSAPQLNFSFGSCSYSAQISGAPPARLINGSASCPIGLGTWEAVKGGGSVQSVTVSPPTGSVVAGGTVRLRAVVIDASGTRRVGPSVTWTSDAPALATVDAAGVVTGVAPGSATITAAAETQTNTSTINVEVVTFATVQAGAYHSCGLTSSGAAYCWGGATFGALGDGSNTSTRTPVPVAGGPTFTSIGTGNLFACGLTAAGAAFCWGNNTAGQLGIGATSPETCNAEPCSTTPVAVSGGLTFTALSVGYWHACGLTSSGAAYCWGDNDGGQLGALTTGTCLGMGATVACSRVPLAVATSVTFAQISAGAFHSCGRTAGGDGYCWGANGQGQLGNATNIRSPFPTLVAGSLSFANVSAF